MTEQDYDLGLKRQVNSFDATLVISVYRNTAFLTCILEALRYQTLRTFEIIVSEDGHDEQMREVLKPYLRANMSIQHITQEDLGFRKNRALNNAIRYAQSDVMIFIDGDCVPHVRFIESHVKSSDNGVICSGRRVELGQKFSQTLVRRPEFIKKLSNSWSYSAKLPGLLLDGVKNPESGYFSPLLQSALHGRPLSIVGCNFSCKKSALFDINGFNEDYESPGIGEDTDIEWRLSRAGYRTKNIKFLVPLLHLWHPRCYIESESNISIYKRTRSRDQWRTSRGLAPNNGGWQLENKTPK
jgi:GT2 family glycosyltransferase